MPGASINFLTSDRWRPRVEVAEVAPPGTSPQAIMMAPARKFSMFIDAFLVNRGTVKSNEEREGHVMNW